MTIKEYQDKLNKLVDEMLDERVEHVSFGLGTIVVIDEDKVIIKYDGLDHEKMFCKSNFFKFNFPTNENIVEKLQVINCEFELANKKEITKKEEVKEVKKTIKSPSLITFDDVIGLEEVKEEINKLIVYPFKYQDIYKAFNKDSGGGVLLYGVPGCGKTMIVKAIANEVDAKLFSIKCSDIKTKWYGESEGKIKTVFDQARRHKKAIIFFDEFDSLGVDRDGEGGKHDKSLVAELLTQIDGFDSDKEDNTLLLIAATNKPWNIDSALLRSGRFTKKIFVGLPDYESIINIIKKELKNIPSEDINYEEVVSGVSNFSSADVVSLCNEAKDYAIKRSIADNKISPITTDDLLLAKDKIKSTINLKELKRLESFSI